MRNHHNAHNFLRGVVENEEVFGDENFFEDIYGDDDQEDVTSHAHRAKARKMVEEHLENRRNRLRDLDPFEDEDFWK